MTTPRSASSRAIATGGLVLLASALLPAAPAVADTVGGMPPALPALPAGWKSYSNVGFDMYTGEWPLSNMPYGTPPEVMPVLLDVYASRDTLSAPGQVSEFVVTLRRTPDYYPYPVADPERAGITRTNFEAVIDLSSAVDDIDALNVDDFEISSGWEGMNVSYENGILNLSGTFAEGRDILTVGFSTTYRASGDNRLQIGAGASFLRIPIPGSDIGSNTHYGTALAAVAPLVVAEPDLSVVAAADKVTVGPGRTPVTYTVDVTRPVGSTVESFRIEDALQELADDVDLTTLRAVTLTGADSPNVEQDGSTLRAQGRFSGPLGQASTARLSFTVDYVGGGDGTLRNAASVAATSHVPEYSWVPVRLAHSAFTTPATAEELDKRPLHPQFGRETPGASAVVTALTATPTVPSTTPSVTPTPTSSATPTPTPSPTPGEPPIATPTVPASEAPTPEPESTAPPTTTTPASSATPSPDASPAPSTEVTTTLATSPAQSEPTPVGSSDSSRTPDANGTRPEDGDEVTPSTTPEQELATTGAAAGPLLGWAVGASAAGALAVAASRSSHRRRH